MNSEDELEGILHGLYHKTKKEALPWREVGLGYWLDLPESKVRIGIDSPPTEPDYILLTLHRADGKEVARLVSRDGDRHWKAASNLYQLVSRKAGGGDKVLQDVQRFLATSR